MVEPAFLSTEHYRKQTHELVVCVELVGVVKRRIRGSLDSARRLGLVSHACPLEVIWDELQAAVENLDSAVCYLQVLALGE